MSWISNVFSESSDIARLITVVITTFMAFVYLLVNQDFSRRKERRDFMISRLEMFYDSVLEFQVSLGVIETKIKEATIPGHTDIEEDIKSSISCYLKAKKYREMYFRKINFVKHNSMLDLEMEMITTFKDNKVTAETLAKSKADYWLKKIDTMKVEIRKTADDIIEMASGYRP